MRLPYALLATAILLLSACDATTRPAVSPTSVSEASNATIDAVCQLVSKQMGVDQSRIKPETSLGELGCDELDFVELVMEIEERFHISIPDEVAEKLLGTVDPQRGMKNVTMRKLADVVDARRK